MGHGGLYQNVRTISRPDDVWKPGYGVELKLVGEQLLATCGEYNNCAKTSRTLSRKLYLSAYVF